MARKGKCFNPNGISSGPKPPCGKDCAERKAGCSVTCEKWKAYLAERNANYERRRREAENNAQTPRTRKDSQRYLYRHKKTGA